MFEFVVVALAIRIRLGCSVGGVRRRFSREGFASQSVLRIALSRETEEHRMDTIFNMSMLERGRGERTLITHLLRRFVTFDRLPPLVGDPSTLAIKPNGGAGRFPSSPSSSSSNIDVKQAQFFVGVDSFDFPDALSLLLSLLQEFPTDPYCPGLVDAEKEDERLFARGI